MKHLALRATSAHSSRVYTATGLGDRVHAATVAWAYGQAHGMPVTLHLTARQWTGGQFGNKPESWAEIASLFPAGAVLVRAHPVEPASESEWLVYLQEYGAELYGYYDYPGRHERGLDISKYLRSVPLLRAVQEHIELPERFFTVQWDSSSIARSLPQEQRRRLIEIYRQEGFDAVVVGGESPDRRLSWSLRHIAHAMSMAAFHVGVDSGFYHMAVLYLPPERIHLYHQPGHAGHHVMRARDNGARINLHL